MATTRPCASPPRRPRGRWRGSIGSRPPQRSRPSRRTRSTPDEPTSAPCSSRPERRPAPLEVPAFWYQRLRAPAGRTDSSSLTPDGAPQLHGALHARPGPVSGAGGGSPGPRRADEERSFAHAPASIPARAPWLHPPEQARPALPRLDDGSPYFAVGENLGWYDGRGTYAYDELVRAARRAGRELRPDLDAVAGPSASSGSRHAASGDYTDRLDRAWQLDTVLERGRARRHRRDALAAQPRRVLALLQLASGRRTRTTPRTAVRSPRPPSSSRDASARALFERRLRYVVARWG